MGEGRPKVVIVGGGFAGIEAAKRLGNTECDVTVVDRHNYHLFQPLLYQIATGGLSPADIAAPIRSVVSPYCNITVLLGEVTGLDVAGRLVLMGDRAIPYDVLIAATGMQTSYFGHNEWEKAAPGIKNIDDATAMRSRIYLAFEAAEQETDPKLQREWLTFVIVGGGPTGVEMAGALAEITRDSLKRDFRHIRPEYSQILLLDATDRLLSAFRPSLSDDAMRELIRKGVRPMMSYRVQSVDDRGVTVLHGDETVRIDARTVLWAAGVTATPLPRVIAEQCSVQTDRSGRVPVEPDLTVPGHPEIFVVGDIMHRVQDGDPLPGVAQVAMQSGVYAANVIRARLSGKPAPRPFHYFDRGSLAVIGRNAAVAEIGRLNFHGFIGWAIWLFIHIAYLIGFESRIVVMSRWAVNYLSHHRGARLITGGMTTPTKEEKAKQPG